jgi:hypothetical protein
MDSTSTGGVASVMPFSPVVVNDLSAPGKYAAPDYLTSSSVDLPPEISDDGLPLLHVYSPGTVVQVAEYQLGSATGRSADARWNPDAYITPNAGDRFGNAGAHAILDDLFGIYHGLVYVGTHPVSTVTSVAGAVVHPVDTLVSLYKAGVSAERTLVANYSEAKKNGTLPEFWGSFTGHGLVVAAGFATGTEEVEGAEAAEASLKLASSVANGNPEAIVRGLGELNARQAAVLAQLPLSDSQVIVGKAFGLNDLAALTAATGDEFAMFSTGGRRLIIRGGADSVEFIDTEKASELAAQGWRLSAHVHPGTDSSVLRSSEGDRAVLGAMGGNRSAILNSVGQRSLFTPLGDDLSGWRPWPW